MTNRSLLWHRVALALLIGTLLFLAVGYRMVVEERAFLEELLHRQAAATHRLKAKNDDLQKQLEVSRYIIAAQDERLERAEQARWETEQRHRDR